MAEKLAKAIRDRTFAKYLLLAEEERSDDLAQKLAVFQEQCRTTKKIWFEEVSHLRGQLLV